MQAYQAHQMGDIGRAEPLYLELIAIDPKGFDAFQLLGALMLQAKRPACRTDTEQRNMPRHR